MNIVDLARGIRDTEIEYVVLGCVTGRISTNCLDGTACAEETGHMTTQTEHTCVDTYGDDGCTSKVEVDCFRPGEEIYLDVYDYTTISGDPLNAVAILNADEARLLGEALLRASGSTP